APAASGARPMPAAPPRAGSPGTEAPTTGPRMRPTTRDSSKVPPQVSVESLPHAVERETIATPAGLTRRRGGKHKATNGPRTGSADFGSRLPAVCERSEPADRTRINSAE